MTATLPAIALPGDIDQFGNRLITNKPMYVTATENDGLISAYISVRCDDTQSWMVPLVREIQGATLVTEEWGADPWMVGGEAVYRVYQI